MIYKESSGIVNTFLLKCTPEEIIREYLAEKSNCEGCDIDQLPPKLLTDTIENLKQCVAILIQNSLNRLL